MIGSFTLNARSFWISATIIGGLITSLSLLGLITLLLVLYNSPTDDIIQLQDTDLRDFSSENGTSTQSLNLSVTRFHQNVSTVSQCLRWATFLVPAFSVVPNVGHEFGEWLAQFERLELDLSAASRTITAKTRLIDTYKQAEDGLTTINGGIGKSWYQQSTELESIFSLSLEEVRFASEVLSGDMPLYRPSPIRNAMSNLTKTENTMLQAFTFAKEASGLLGDLSLILEQIEPIIAPFSSGTRSNSILDMNDFQRLLVELDLKLRFADARIDNMVAIVNTSDYGYGLEQRLKLLNGLMKVFSDLNDAMILAVSGFGSDLTESGSSSKGIQGVTLVKIFETLAQNESEIAQALILVEKAEATMDDIEIMYEIENDSIAIQDLALVITRIREGMQLAREIAPIGMELIGRESIRRYLLLGQSADEIRATGGFVSAVWLLTVRDGELIDIEYFDAVRVDDWNRLNLYPSAPHALARHMNARVWLIRDVSWEPDFPTTARTAADMFLIGQRRKVDGVIAMNQWTMLSLVEVIGGIRSPEGDEITAHNLFSKLEQGTDRHGRAYVDLVLQGLTDKLKGQSSLTEMISIASAAARSLENRDLLIYLNDSAQQSVIDSLGWTGSIQSVSTDYLFIVDSNVGWSKADRNIERRLTYVADLTRSTETRIKLSIEYKNHSGPGSAGCVPQWLNKGTNYNDLRNACWWNYWRVYVPQGAKLLNSTYLGLPEYSVAVEIGKGVSGDDTVNVDSNFKKTVVSGLFDLAAGNSIEIDLVYDIPITFDRTEIDINYELFIQKQPGVRTRSTTIELIIPRGYTLVSSSVTPVYKRENRVGFSLVVDRNRLFSAVFGKANDIAN